MAGGKKKVEKKSHGSFHAFMLDLMKEERDPPEDSAESLYGSSVGSGLSSSGHSYLISSRDSERSLERSSQSNRPPDSDSSSSDDEDTKRSDSEQHETSDNNNKNDNMDNSKRESEFMVEDTQLAPHEEPAVAAEKKDRDSSEYTTLSTLHPDLGNSKDPIPQSKSSDSDAAVKEGWMQKKGQRRYFVLNGGELSWRKEINQSPRGKIDSIRNYQLFIFGSSAEATEFKMIPEPGRSGRSLVLRTENNAQLKEWLAVLKRAVRIQENAAPPLPSKSGVLIKEGHIVKNKKKRWFLLPTNSQLMSYYKQKDNPKPQGVINLQGALLYVDTENPKVMIIKTKDTAKVFNLEAEKAEERKNWLDIILLRDIQRVSSPSELVV
eukprot:TRINITY_DN5474_c0_g1_i1.p1 TRINITY_DN5474_c0_g1~~TRINITY_DN5474_c0_g1_i1.p1  ORF type:complete len:379 (-),score=114.40 TRINITY_DN5474_c0_g1_i1:36-1172(-)